jgi:hypothetical protein
LDSSRLRTGEIVAGIAGIALFVFLFFDWFGGGSVAAGNFTVSVSSRSGWDSLTDLPGFLIIMSGVAGIALAYLAATGQRVNIPVQRGATTALLGSLAVLLILWRMFAGSPTLKIGVFLGLAAAIAITAGALIALVEDGFEPLVKVAGGRTRAAPATASAASAPAATPPPPPASAPAKSSSSSRSGGSTTTKRSTAKKKPAARSGSKAKSSSSGSTSTKKKSSTSRSSASKTKSKNKNSGKSSSSSKKKGRT